MPLREGLRLVHNTLVGIGLRDRIRIGASGKIVSAFDIARSLALGADWCNSARGFMFALGCIQSRSCHTDTCPTGVATQDSVRQRALVVGDKAERVRHFHEQTLVSFAELIGAAGIARPEDLTADHITVRDADGQAVPLSRVVPTIAAGALLDPTPAQLATLSEPFRSYWALATPSRFALAA